MGAKASKNSNSKREPKTLNPNVTTSHQRSSIIESMKPKCLKKRKTTKKKRPRNRKMTLGDWLLASPGRKGLNPNSLEGGELYVFKHFPKRVQQSSLNLCSGDDVSGTSFSRRNRSGKSKKKKKVRFMLPEEGDIVVFYSAAEAFESE